MNYPMKKAFLYVLILLSCSAGFAQKAADKYREDAKALRKEVWAWNIPEFGVRTIPSQYAKSSAIIMARHIDIDADSRKKANITGMGFGLHRELTIMEIIREMIKINDQAALSEYSEFSYTQMEKTAGRVVDKKMTMYLGVRVIKPNGTVTEINADDIVLTKDEKKEKQAKIAIPDLQVGDIVDYFIGTQVSMEQQGIPPYIFTFFDDKPIMYSSIHCEIGKKYAVEYRAFNGAPDFKETKGENDGNILDATIGNIPSYPENSLWVSAYRQLPIIRMNILIGRTGRSAGKVYKNQDAGEFVDDELKNIGMEKLNVYRNGIADVWQITAGDYVKKLKRAKISVDSLSAELYYAYRFDTYLDVLPFTDPKRIINYSSAPINHLAYLVNLSMFLKNKRVPNDMVLSSSKYGPGMKTLMSCNDLGEMLLIKGPNPAIFGMTDIFSPAYYIPYYFENTNQAITVNTGNDPTDIKGKNFDLGTINIPLSTAEQNVHLEKLDLKFSVDKNTLMVSRNTTLTGHYKSDVQKDLILFEDFYESERKLLGKKTSLIEEFQDVKRSRKYADELKTAFDAARVNQKDAFINEAKNWFELDINDLHNNKVDNLGVRHYDPDFVYSSEFLIPGLIKKAGNNIFIEIGKLQGSPLKVSPNQLKRSLDIYAPFARSLQYEMRIEIPDGFTVEGLNKLNKKIENECGLFSCESTTDGKSVIIKVNKIYKNSFELSSKWDKLVAIIDAANDWSNTKLIFKKK